MSNGIGIVRRDKIYTNVWYSSSRITKTMFNYVKRNRNKHGHNFRVYVRRNNQADMFFPENSSFCVELFCKDCGKNCIVTFFTTSHSKGFYFAHKELNDIVKSFMNKIIYRWKNAYFVHEKLSECVDRRLQDIAFIHEEQNKYMTFRYQLTIC